MMFFHGKRKSSKTDEGYRALLSYCMGSGRERVLLVTTAPKNEVRDRLLKIWSKLPTNVAGVRLFRSADGVKFSNGSEILIRHV